MQQQFLNKPADFALIYPRLPLSWRNRYIYALTAAIFGFGSIMGYPYLVGGPYVDLSGGLIFAIAIGLIAAILWPRGKRSIPKMIFTMFLVGFVGSLLFPILMTLTDAISSGGFSFELDELAFALKFGLVLFFMGGIMSLGTAYLFGGMISALFADD